MIVRVDHVDLENRGSGRMVDDDWNHTGLDPNSDRFEASRVSYGERGCDRKLMKRASRVQWDLGYLGSSYGESWS
jgi:hypothetical protein